MSTSNNVNFQSVVILGLKTALLEAESEINRLRNKLSQVEHEALQCYLKYSKTELICIEKVSKLNELKNKLRQELKAARNEFEEQKKELADKENENINLQFKVKEIKSLLDIKIELLESLNIKGDKVDKNSFNDYRSEYRMLVRNLKTIVKNQPSYPEHQVLEDVRKLLFKMDKGKPIDVSKYTMRKIKTEKKGANDNINDASNDEKILDLCNEELKCSDTRTPDNISAPENSPQLPNSEMVRSLEEKMDNLDEKDFVENSKRSIPLNWDLDEKSSGIISEISTKSIPCFDVANMTKNDNNIQSVETSASKNTDLTSPSIDVMSDSEGDETSGFCDGETEAESPTDIEFYFSQQLSRNTASPESHTSTQCMPDLILENSTQSAAGLQSRNSTCISNSRINLPDTKTRESTKSSNSITKPLPMLKGISKAHETKSCKDQTTDKMEKLKNPKTSNSISKQLPEFNDISNPLEMLRGEDQKTVEFFSEMKNSTSSNSISMRLPPVSKDISKPLEMECSEVQKIDKILDEMKKLKALTSEFLELKQFNDESQNEINSNYIRPFDESSVALRRNQNFNLNVQNGNASSNFTNSKENSEITSLDKRPIELLECNEINVENINSKDVVKVNESSKETPLVISSPKLNNNISDIDTCCFKKPIDVHIKKVERTKTEARITPEETTSLNTTTDTIDNTASKIYDESTVKNIHPENLGHHPSKSSPRESLLEMKDYSKYSSDIAICDNQESASFSSATDLIISISSECKRSTPVSKETTPPIVPDKKIIETEDSTKENAETLKHCIGSPAEICSSMNPLAKLEDATNDVDDQNEKISNVSFPKDDSPSRDTSNSSSLKNFQPVQSTRKNDHTKECATEQSVKIRRSVRSKIEVVSNASSVVELRENSLPGRRKTVKSKIVAKTSDPVAETVTSESIQTMNNGMERRKRKGKYSEILDSLKSKPKRRKLSDGEVTELETPSAAVTPEKSRRGRKKKCIETTKKENITPNVNWSPRIKTRQYVLEMQQPIEVVQDAPKQIEIITESDNPNDASPVPSKLDVEIENVSEIKSDPKMYNNEKTEEMKNQIEISSESEGTEKIINEAENRGSFVDVETSPRISSKIEIQQVVLPSVEIIEPTKPVELETSIIIPPKIEVNPEELHPLETVDKPGNKSIFDMTAPLELEHVNDEEEYGEISFEIGTLLVEKKIDTKNIDTNTPETVASLSSNEEEIKIKNYVSELTKHDELSLENVNRSISDIESKVRPFSDKNYLITDTFLDITPEVKIMEMENTTETSFTSEEEIVSDEEPIEMSSKLGPEAQDVLEKQKTIVEPSSINKNRVENASEVKCDNVVSVEKNSKPKKALIPSNDREIVIPPTSTGNSTVESLFETNELEKIDIFRMVEEMVAFNKCSLARFEELSEFLKVDSNIASTKFDTNDAKIFTNKIVPEISSNVFPLPSERIDQIQAKENEEDDDSENEMLVIAEDDHTNIGSDGIETNKFNCRDTNKINGEPVPANGRSLPPRCPAYRPPTRNKVLELGVFDRGRTPAPACLINECENNKKSPVVAAPFYKISGLPKIETKGIDKNTESASSEANAITFQFYKENQVRSADVVKEKTPFEEIWESIKSIHVDTPSTDEDLNLISCYRPVTHMAFHYKRKYERKCHHKNPLLKAKKIKESIHKFIKEVASNEFVAIENFKSSMSSVDPYAIATGLMAVAITGAKQEMSLMIETEGCLVNLCFELTREHNDFLTHVKTVVKDKMFTKVWETDQYDDTNMVPGVIALSVFYTILCQRDDDIKSLKELLFESLCLMKYRSHPIAYGILKVYPTIFNHLSKHCLLSQIILFTLINHSMDRNPNLYRVQEIRDIIEKYYGIRLGYKAAEDHVREAMFQFNDDTWVDAIVLLCKRQQFPWSYTNVIMKYLLQIVNRWKEHDFSEMILLKTVLALHQIIRCCPMRMGNGVRENLVSNEETSAAPKCQIYNIDLIANSLADVLNSGKGSRELHETIAFTICEISYLSFERCCHILFNWKPANGVITNKALEKLNSSMKQGRIFPSWFQFVAPQKFAVEYKIKKHRKTSLESRNGVLKVGLTKNLHVPSTPQQKKKKKKKKKSKR